MPLPPDHPPPAVPDHELFRVIGSGAYGEVWLARSMLGTLRAVKVIRRDAFESERPYERELRGISQFEPVSRAHEGLVDILQAGKAADGSLFYYVMELADAVNMPVSPPDETGDLSLYTPRTLAVDMAAGARLDPDFCARVFKSLASALQFLHSQGLVHRDIKPSNIIFVKGEPKLADIGMVAGLDETRSWVGTDGYMPPEGPGTPAADVFSLGKVLYETATGRDRREFPELPADASPTDAALLELNRVWLRACAPAPSARYASAGAMAADLGCIVAGGSLRARRKRRGILVATGVAALLAACAGAWHLWPEKKRSPVAAVGVVLHALPWIAPEPEAPILADAAHNQTITGLPDGTVSVREMLTQKEFFRIDVPGENSPVARFAAVSPDGKWFAAIGLDGYLRFRRSKEGAGAWGVKRDAAAAPRAIAFNHDHLRLAWSPKPSVLQLYATRNWSESKTETPLPGRIRHLAWSGNDQWIGVAMSDPPALLLITPDSLKTARTIPLPAIPSWIEWKAGSDNLAWVATAAGVLTIDTSASEMVRTLFPDKATVLAADRDAHWLAACSDGGILTIWNLRRPDNRPVIEHVEGENLSWSPDGSQLAIHAGHADSLKLFNVTEPAL